MSQEKESTKVNRPPWLADLLVAITLLVVILSVVAFLYGRAVIERLFLAVFVLVAWLGALVGLKIPGGPGKQ
jgi:hypothetical protein